MTAEPELYALTHRGSPGDVAFYVDACRGATTVLELGCGYARLLAPLAQAGHTAVGLDRDPGLLRLAAAAVAALPDEVRARVELVEADMRDFALGRRFDRVLIPYSALYCLGSRDGQRRALAAAARHLAPGGRLLFDAWAADDFHRFADPREPEDDDPLATVHWRGRLWDVHERSNWDPGAQRLRAHYSWRPHDGGAPRHDRVEHRYLLVDELPALCRDAGLRLESVRGDFEGGPLDADSEQLVCTASAA